LREVVEVSGDPGMLGPVALLIDGRVLFYAIHLRQVFEKMGLSALTRAKTDDKGGFRKPLPYVFAARRTVGHFHDVHAAARTLREVHLEALEHFFFDVFDVSELFPTSDIAVFTGVSPSPFFPMAQVLSNNHLRTPAKEETGKNRGEVFEREASVSGNPDKIPGTQPLI
jgi:hypothetical protein